MIAQSIDKVTTKNELFSASQILQNQSTPPITPPRKQEGKQLY